MKLSKAAGASPNRALLPHFASWSLLTMHGRSLLGPQTHELGGRGSFYYRFRHVAPQNTKWTKAAMQSNLSCNRLALVKSSTEASSRKGKMYAHYHSVVVWLYCALLWLPMEQNHGAEQGWSYSCIQLQVCAGMCSTDCGSLHQFPLELLKHKMKSFMLCQIIHHAVGWMQFQR